jgi:hypothetical protein
MERESSKKNPATRALVSQSIPDHEENARQVLQRRPHPRKQDRFQVKVSVSESSAVNASLLEEILVELLVPELIREAQPAPSSETKIAALNVIDFPSQQSDLCS